MKLSRDLTAKYAKNKLSPLETWFSDFYETPKHVNWAKCQIWKHAKSEKTTNYRVLQECCLEIYIYTLLSRLFHFTATWTLDFLLNKHKSIRRHQTSTILITQIHPGHNQLAASGIELTTPISTQWAWFKGGHALTLSAIGVPDKLQKQCAFH